MTQNRRECLAVERIDRRGLTKDRRAARSSFHERRAAALVVAIAEGLNNRDDLEMALDASLSALSKFRSRTIGHASTVALHGRLAKQEGVGIKSAKPRPDWRTQLAEAAGEVEL